jgi:hypothetical protein
VQVFVTFDNYSFAAPMAGAQHELSSSITSERDPFAEASLIRHPISICLHVPLAS